MKIIIISVLVLMLINTVMAYQYNESGYKMDMDFTNGGIQEGNSNYNVSIIMGESMTPFNDTQTQSTIYQGLYYIIWSDTLITEVIAPFIKYLNLTIEAFDINWIKINWT